MVFKIEEHYPQIEVAYKRAEELAQEEDKKSLEDAEYFCTWIIDRFISYEKHPDCANHILRFKTIVLRARSRYKLQDYKSALNDLDILKKIKISLKEDPQIGAEVYYIYALIHYELKEKEKAKYYIDKSLEYQETEEAKSLLKILINNREQDKDNQNKQKLEQSSYQETLKRQTKKPWQSMLSFLSKQGYTEAECEDKAAVKQLQTSPIVIQAAIADGVSQAIFSGEWANILVNNFVEKELDIFQENKLNNWVIEQQANWQKFIRQQSLSWMSRRKLKSDQGTYATFLGLKIEQTYEGWQWQALAIGDCCLFIVKDNALITAFPLTNSQELNQVPAQLGSEANYNNSTKFTQGTVDKGSHFYIVTDALAGWIMRNLEMRVLPWNTLESHREQEKFSPWIKKLRYSKDREEYIRDDDTTLVHICVD
jgi:hypothetical protein